MNEALTSQLEKIKTRALADDGFKQRLFADPVSVLREEGVEMQSLAAANGELSVSELDQVSAGTVMDSIWAAIVNAVGSTDNNTSNNNNAVVGVRG